MTGAPDECSRWAALLPGLANLEQRAEALGGHLLVGPADGGGTELRWQVPLSGPADSPTAW